MVLKLNYIISINCLQKHIIQHYYKSFVFLSKEIMIFDYDLIMIGYYFISSFSFYA